jgi:hypothetical protein
MPENVAFYSQTYDALPADKMAKLAGKAKLTVEQGPEGGHRSFVYRWRGLTVRCNEMPPAELPSHLDGFCGYVRQIYRVNPDARGQQILERIRYTRLVVGVVIDPGRDRAGRAEQVLGAMANGLDALLFFDSALYDKNVKLLLGPDGSFDAKADVLDPVAEQIRNRERIRDRGQVDLPEDEPFPATPDQQARFERVREILAVRKVPTLEYPLYIDDDATVTLRTPAEVARRALVLSAVTFRAEGGDRDEAMAMMERHDLLAEASPEEMELLRAQTPDSESARKLLWRLEALWMLTWALGDVELDWPEQFCNVPRLVEITRAHEDDPDFIGNAKLRSKAEILDAVQLTMLIHWAVRDAWVHQRIVPENLDWERPAEMVPVPQNKAGGVVAERHHALNWLIRYGGADWDDVDTPT